MLTKTLPERTPLLDLPAVAERLGVNHRHVRRLVAERRIPYLKWGHLLRFDPAEIEVWLNDARVQAGDRVRSALGPDDSGTPRGSRLVPAES